MHFELTEEQRMILEIVRDFAETELAPGALERDINKTQALDQWKKFYELGFAGMTIEEEYGGTPLDAISEAMVIEELSRVDVAAPGRGIHQLPGCFGQASPDLKEPD